MIDSLQLRPIIASDNELLFKIYASTRAEELAILDWSDVQKADFLRMQFNAQHQFYQTEFPAASFQIVLAGGRAIGRLYVDRRADEIRIVDIALLPEYRRAGIGSALLKDVLAEGSQAGQPVRIHVERSNPALRLYERLGFVIVGDSGVYFLMEWLPPENSELSGASA